MLPDMNMIRVGWNCKCPRCHKGDIYQSSFSLNLRDRCVACDLDLAKNDSADGPAVLLIFILGFLLVPIALYVAMHVDWPLWLHGMIWGVITLVLTIGMLRPAKAYIIALQYKHLPWTSE